MSEHKSNDKRGNSRFMGFISVMAVLVMLLLIASCQPVNVEALTKLEVSNHE